MITVTVTENMVSGLPHLLKNVMTKFKLFERLKKGYRASIKCFGIIKYQLMDRSETGENAKYNGTKKKKIQAKKSPLNRDLYSSQSEEGFIPLAARDSKWVDLAFYNPNFKNQQEDDECDEEELQIIDGDGVLKPPILLLFPGLAEKDSSNLLTNVSTSDVTKMLVGQKPDFSRMKSSRKLLPTENTLTSVQEMPQEEVESTNQSVLSPRSSGYSEPNEIQDTDEEVQRKTHIKRRKKLSDVTVNVKDSDTSVLVVKELRKRPYAKPKPRRNVTLLHKDSEVKHPSSNGSLGDDEAD